MYALMGAAVGWFGISADWLGLQATSSFSIGVFLALGVILFYSAQYGSFKIFKKGRKWSQQLMAKGLQKKGCTGAILIGLANGLIPCGMVYMAIAASLSTGNSLEAALFMLLFGAGTLPAFSLLSQLSGWVYKNTRFSFHSVMPILVLISAFVLMGRGIYFYKIDKNNSSITVCE